MAARDRELREGRGGEPLERDLGLARQALDHQRPRALLEVRRQRVGQARRSIRDEREEAGEELARLARALAPVSLERFDRRIGLRLAARDPEAGRLDHGERTDELGALRGGEERDDASVRVAGEMVAPLEPLGDPAAVLLEVDRGDRRPGREAGPVEDNELETLGEGGLRRPGRGAVADAAVDEHESGPRGHGRSYRRNKLGTKWVLFLQAAPISGVTSSISTLVCSPRMEHAPRKSPSGVSAGMLLTSAIVLTIGVGALLGALAGSVGLGIVIGAVVGIPLGTAVVLVVYRGSGT